MCDFKFVDFTPNEIIKIMESDIKQHQKKYEYHMGIAKSYQSRIEELEVKIGKLRQKSRKKTLEEN